MNLKSSDLDAIFNGASSVINTTQNITQAIANGVNDVHNIMDTSRRSIQMSQPSNYQAPVTYGYGYSDNGYPGYNGMGYNYYNQNQYQMNTGYAGFTNPNYGSTAGSYYQNGFNVSGPQGGAWF